MLQLDLYQNYYALCACIKYEISSCKALTAVGLIRDKPKPVTEENLEVARKIKADLDSGMNMNKASKKYKKGYSTIRRYLDWLEQETS